MLVLPFINYQNLVILKNIDLNFWIHLLIVSAGALSFGTTTYFIASQNLGPEKSSSFIFTVPISALGASVIILNEELTIITFIGCLLTILAVRIINFSNK